MIDEIRKIIFDSILFKDKINFTDGELNVSGLHGSLLSFFIDKLQTAHSKKIVYLSSDVEKIYKVKGDLDVISELDNVSVFSSDKNTESEEYTRTLNFLTNSEEFIVLVHSDILSKKLIQKKKYKESLLSLKKNDEYLFEELISKLEDYQFVKRDFVDEVGDYSVRGGIIDLFPEHYDSPLRIEFFGETIESIREFDIKSQRSLKELQQITIGINLSFKEEEENGLEGEVNITDYFSDDIIVIVDEKESIADEQFLNWIKSNRRVFISAFKSTEGNVLDFGSKVQPDLSSNIKSLFKNLDEYIEKDYQTFVLSSDEHQSDRLKSLIYDVEEDFLIEEKIESKVSHRIQFYNESLQEGFILPACKLLVYTEHQVFGRYFRQTKKRKKRFRGMTFDEVKELKLGDYVVHRDFGVGIYSGLRKIKVGNNQQEVAKLSYAGGDTIFLNLNYVNLINKYSAGEGVSPALTRLGGGEWMKMKEKAKKKVKDIARDLILLYAKRKSAIGFSYSPDSHWQRELEANFMYEDTPDQFSATEDVKQDMMNENPMDRLVCGDVGFGKTEVAVRAAFKAVLDNKQVAVLVPTTILAVQHYNTFRDRLNSFAVDVQVISRLQTRKEQKEILEKLAEGKVNILIGTHRLLSKDIIFKDLGLLVIDEEQRFGVKAKEKLRAIQPNIDTLTLTATPIPRTLNFSLLGARDLSVINTPPKNRKPIITEIVQFNWTAISDIIKKELDRDGQVYFVNDKIDKLYELADKLKEYIPYAKTGIGHGQMDANELEDVIVDFIEKKLNVLFCTKIIESGLDIPNVNTIIINNANMYGLSELYQLRGRVGRSDTQAYAYFVSPPAGKLTKTAIRRLQAIEEYTELGSGFNLAMRDMEIRGVGNLLGKDQSGFVHQMGFEMFIDIIDEAVSELKENEFKEIFKEEESLKKISEKIKKREEFYPTIVENDLNALIPEEYIENDTERLNIYKRLYEVKTKPELKVIEDELRDRFGGFSSEVGNLLSVIEIKVRATEIGLEKINISGNEMLLYFPEEKDHRIFKSDFFNNLVQRLSATKTRKYTFVNNKDKLIVLVNLDSKDEEKRIEEIRKMMEDLLFGGREEQLYSYV
ncbi:MAG: transcription-repair coupling factor [Ignavibacteriae bacterium]|nr:transcription-repair coupling factor [Ignavibacteriota bacterium]